jgi:hypothetical protein
VYRHVGVVLDLEVLDEGESLGVAENEIPARRSFGGWRNACEFAVYSSPYTGNRPYVNPVSIVYELMYMGNMLWLCIEVAQYESRSSWQVLQLDQRCLHQLICPFSHAFQVCSSCPSIYNNKETLDSISHPTTEHHNPS